MICLWLLLTYTVASVGKICCIAAHSMVISSDCVWGPSVSVTIIEISEDI